MTLRFGFNPDPADPDVLNGTLAPNGSLISSTGVNTGTEPLRGIALYPRFRGAGVNVRVMLYDSSNSLVAQGEVAELVADVENRIDFTAPFTPTDGATYRYAIQADNDVIGVYQDTSLPANQQWAEMVNDYTTGAPATFVAGSTSNKRQSYVYVYGDAPVTTPIIRKSSTFDIETTLGTITTATLNSVNVFDHVTGQVGTTVSFAGAATDEITTSGEYDLVLGDGAGTETITVQVNVYGVAPSNNPLQKDGSALASLTGVQVRITNGSDLNGAQLEYLPAATTDASGNLGNIDLSATAVADADPVLLHMRTAAGDSIIASETVGLI